MAEKACFKNCCCLVCSPGSTNTQKGFGVQCCVFCVTRVVLVRICLMGCLVCGGVRCVLRVCGLWVFGGFVCRLVV